jgi:hypothetical protein
MLYTCLTSLAARKETKKMKHYYIVPGHGNDAVTPDTHDLDLYKNGIMTEKGFALNYEMKLRSREAYEWMLRVSGEATDKDVVMVGEKEGAEKSYLTRLAEMMASMFGGKMNFRYMGELK